MISDYCPDFQGSGMGEDIEGTQTKTETSVKRL